MLFIRYLVFQSLVKPLVDKECYESFQAVRKLRHCIVVVQEDTFILQGPQGLLNENVIQASSNSFHAYSDSIALNHCYELLVLIPGPAVCVQNGRKPMSCDCLHYAIHTELCIHHVAEAL